MAKSPSSSQSLLLLLLAGLAAAGWFYGIHWKRVASGDLFTKDEKLMIRLQDQIQTLTTENEQLHSRIRSLSGENATESASGEAPPTDAASPAPMLPSPPQKIETH